MRLRRVIRSPLVFWPIAAVLALLSASLVGRLVATARADAARYGSPRTVAVAVRAIAAGETLRPGDVEAREVPAALLPDGTVAPADAAGRTVVVPLFPGEPLVAAKLAPDGLRGVAALVPRGRRGVAVPTNGVSAPVAVGDRVDVLASFEPELAGEGDATFPVARGATVVAAGDDAVTVAVTPDEANRVAFAVANGIVTLAVTGWPS